VCGSGVLVCLLVLLIRGLILPAVGKNSTYPLFRFPQPALTEVYCVTETSDGNDSSDMATLFLLCGLPGSGKLTLAKKIERERPALRLTPDEWMERLVGHGYDEEKRAAIEALQWDIAQRALSLGIDVILESGF
jgi:AAA domain